MNTRVAEDCAVGLAETWTMIAASTVYVQVLETQMLTTIPTELDLDRCETFADFVLRSLTQLAPALDFTARLFDSSGITIQRPAPMQLKRGLEWLAFDLYTIAVSFAYADGNIARQESLLLSGLAHLLRGLASAPFVEINMAAFMQVKAHENWYLPLIGLELILQYDSVFEAQQSDVLKLLYYRFAEEMVEADGQIMPTEQERLIELKARLSPFPEADLAPLYPETPSDFTSQHPNISLHQPIPAQRLALKVPAR